MQIWEIILFMKNKQILCQFEKGMISEVGAEYDDQFVCCFLIKIIIFHILINTLLKKYYFDIFRLFTKCDYRIVVIIGFILISRITISVHVSRIFYPH